jgi:hypothetical protein
MGVREGPVVTGQWLPGASRLDLSVAPWSRGNGPFDRFLGVILHVNVDENGTSDAFYETNPGQVTPTFQVYKDGTAHQYLPLDWQPWCQVDGNYNYGAIETAGLPSEPLTDAQCATIGRILAFYHSQLGMQLTVADTPGQAGLGWHGMGGAAWGGHTGCPGELRKAQRPHLLALAIGGTPAPPKPTPPAPAPKGPIDMLLVQDATTGAIYQQFADGHLEHIEDINDVYALAARLGDPAKITHAYLAQFPGVLS